MQSNHFGNMEEHILVIFISKFYINANREFEKVWNLLNGRFSSEHAFIIKAKFHTSDRVFRIYILQLYKNNFMIKLFFNFSETDEYQYYG